MADDEIFQEPESEAPAEGEGAAEALPPAPIPAIFLCRFCRKGRLDPGDRKPGEDMACPACGKLTKVTLEHTLGEERVSRRQKARQAQRVPFHQLPEDKQLEILAKKTGAEKYWYLLMYHLGPKGMVVLYLGIVVIAATAALAYALTLGGMEIKDHPWWYWLVYPLVGAAVGLAGFFGWVTFKHYRAKAHSATADLRENRGSTRRRLSSVRTKASGGGGKPKV